MTSTDTGGWWGFQARLLPYLEAKDIYNLCNFSYPGNCFDWIAIQPPGMNPAVMILGYDNVPMTRCMDDICASQDGTGQLWLRELSRRDGNVGNRQRRHPPSRRPQQRHQPHTGHRRGLAHASSWVNAALATLVRLALLRRRRCLYLAPVRTGDGDNLMTHAIRPVSGVSRRNPRLSLLELPSATWPNSSGPTVPRSP